MNRAIIFDFDGTLLDTMPVFDSIVRQQLEQRGVVLSKQKEKQLIALYIEKAADVQYGGGKLSVVRIFSQLGQACGLGLISRISFTIATVRTIRRAYHNAEHFPDSQEILALFKEQGFLLALVTMASKNNLEKSLGDLRQYFEVIITRDDVKKTKPDPEAFTKVCQTLNVKAEDCYAIGDLPIDIIAAQRAGIPALAVTTGISSKELLKLFNPVRIFSSLTDASKWILDQNPSKNLE
ncbi:MAG: HAD family hydrolase [Candidatus Hermodarchaeota archaeon]